MQTAVRATHTNPRLARVIEAEFAKLFPVVSDDGKTELRATKIAVGDTGFDPHGVNAQQQARQSGGTLGVPIIADLELVREGKVVQRRRADIATLPMMTSLGTFMVGGNDYFTPMAQLRLKPGVYTREKANGEFESFIPTKGSNITIWMDPSKGVVKLGHYSTNVNWLSIVRALGARDDEIIDALGGGMRGQELLAANNKAAKYDTDVDRLFKSVNDRKVDKNLVRAGVIKHVSAAEGLDTAAKAASLQQWFPENKVDPFVTRRTLGKEYESLSKDVLLAAAKKMIGVFRREVEPDDRDSPEFKSAHDTVDLIAERFRKVAPMLQRELRKELGRPDISIGKVLGKGWADVATVGYFGGMKKIEGGIAHTAEAANPLAILSEHTKTTLTGEGGIGDSHAITINARLFRPIASNYIDPSHTPEGAEIGVSTHTTVGAFVKDNKLHSQFFKAKNGQLDLDNPVEVSVEEASEKVIGYPEYWDRTKTGKPLESPVRAVKKNEIVMVDPKEVDYVIPSGQAMFDHTSNAALILASTHPNRAMMAGKHLTQALPLVHREVSAIKLMDEFGKNVHENLASAFTIRSRVSGKVEEVTPSHITVAGVKHEIFDHYPMQAKVVLHHEPLVKVGDTVKEGDLLADTNYTKGGQFALGTHLRSAYMPWKNASNYEDAIVISESAATKLTSEHMHREWFPLDPQVQLGAKLFAAQFPTKIKTTNLAQLDTEGVIKQGEKVEPGTVLIAAVRKKKFDDDDKSAKNLGQIHKLLLRPFTDASLVWEEDFPGEVVRVVKLKDHIEVHVKTLEPARVGDKLSMSSAAKGTISQIVPDDKMPHDEKKRHMEIIFNPHGVAGRINPSQTLEQAANKLIIDGKDSYSYINFDGLDHAKIIKEKLEAKGLKHAEILHDPETGRDLERPVGVGYNYVFKLDHPVRKKFSARGREGYTQDETPTVGRGKGGQSYDHLTTYALLGHNAHAILGESYGIRGTKNDEYWQAYQAGERPPPPKVPYVFDRFNAMLNAAGVNTERKGTIMHFMPMTDAAVMDRSNGEIKNPHRVRAKDLAEEKGGLFDPEITGGVKGEAWSHIDLGTKIPHPLYEKVIRDVTGITQAEFFGLLSGSLRLDPSTKKIGTQPQGLTGDAAFKELLSFDVKSKIAEQKRVLQTAVGSDRNRAYRSIRYLQGLEKTGLTAHDAYMVSKVPVLPPKYRPLVEQKDGSIRDDSANLLYRDLMLTRNALQQGEKSGFMPQEELGKARVGLYEALAATVGVGKALTRPRNEELRGFIQVIKGKSNKEGLFQQMITRRRNDFSGRSTIEPDAELGMDEIGLPEEMAWKLYEPTVVRKMVLAGWKPADASLAVRDRTLAARNYLQAEMKERPVLYNRAPSLHRWSVLAATPKITPGQEIRTSPFSNEPLNSDHDGDTISVHVPITDEAKRESHNLLPQNNLFYDRDRSLVFAPGKDVIAGIFAMTRDGIASGKSYKTTTAAIEAFESNRDGLRMNSKVRIDGEPGEPTVGWLIFRSIIPDRFLAGIVPPVNKKKFEEVLNRVAKETPGDYARISRALMAAGFRFASMAGGISATVDELAIDRSKIKMLLKQFAAELDKVKDKDEKRKAAVALFNTKYKPELTKILKDHLAEHPTGYADIVTSGSSSKANLDQFLQMFVSPVLVKDVHDRVVPTVIQSSYSEGMRPSDFVLTTPGARAGLVARSLSTALPGFLAKELAGNMSGVRVTETDCGTKNGIDHPLHDEKLKDYDADLLDRHLVEDVGGYKRNDVVTPKMLADLRAKKLTHLKTRSAMTCEAASPPCQMCAGRMPDGRVHPIGANIGYNYGQATSERSTQLIMRSFHSGGTVGAGDSLSAGFTRLRELLAAPDTVKGQGTLSDVDGRVTAIRTAPQGGWFVDVGSHEHYVQPGRTITVKLGDAVKTGDPLSNGSYRPQELAQKKGLLHAQQYVVDQARKAYQDAGAIVRKPVIEVVAAGMMRYVEITNDGGEPDLHSGQILHENDFKTRQKRNPKIQATPTVLGLSRKPIMTSDDLFERLNFQRLDDAVREAPAIGATSDLTGSKSPLPGLAYGAMFRKQASAEDDWFDWFDEY